MTRTGDMHEHLAIHLTPGLVDNLIELCVPDNFFSHVPIGSDAGNHVEADFGSNSGKERKTARQLAIDEVSLQSLGHFRRLGQSGSHKNFIVDAPLGFLVDSVQQIPAPGIDVVPVDLAHQGVDFQSPCLGRSFRCGGKYDQTGQ